MGDVSNHCNFAMNYYKQAYKNYKKVRHLVGMYMSKAREKELIVVEENEEETKNLVGKKTKKVKHLFVNIREYYASYGHENGVYINREHGEDMSLMTELILSKTDEPLFPHKLMEPDHKPLGKYSSQSSILLHPKHSKRQQNSKLTESFKIEMNRIDPEGHPSSSMCSEDIIDINDFNDRDDLEDQTSQQELVSQKSLLPLPAKRS